MLLNNTIITGLFTEERKEEKALDFLISALIINLIYRSISGSFSIFESENRETSSAGRKKR